MTHATDFRTWIATALALVMLAGAPGCSYAFVRGPSAAGEVTRDERGVVRPACTTSNALPVVDTVLGVPLVGVGVMGFLIGASGYCNGGWCALTTGTSLAIGVLASGLGTTFLASAVTGYGRTADCREVQEALPGGSLPNARYLLDVEGIAEARARSGMDGR